MARHYLIVDDSPVIRQTLEKMLARFCPDGHRVSSAENSEQALKIFRDEQPDVVFMDIQLPDVDGEQTAQVMFTEDPSTKVIIISGLMEDDQRIRDLISMGAFDFLQKPIHSEDVKELIRLLEEEEDSGAGRIR
jgi:two-component system LytT family response regulator